jgi:hypothetical protein
LCHRRDHGEKRLNREAQDKLEEQKHKFDCFYPSPLSLLKERFSLALRFLRAQR